MWSFRAAEPVQVAPSDTIGNDVVCPSFSPDGTMLAVGMPAGSILVVPIDATAKPVTPFASTAPPGRHLTVRRGRQIARQSRSWMERHS